MALHRIVCILRGGVDAPQPHLHVTHVGVGDERGYRFLWPVEQVIDSIASGDQYAVSAAGDGGGDDLVEVVAAPCPHCGKAALTIAGGGVLVDLPTCPPR